MSHSVGIATFLRFFTGNTTVFRWQNFFVGKTVDDHVYQSFAASDIALNRSASEGGIGLTLPLTKQSLFYMEAAYNEAYLIEVQLYELDLANGMPTGIDGATQIARFVGEVVAMSCDLVTLSVELGAGIDAVSEDIPGRKFTTSLVGRLPVL